MSLQFINLKMYRLQAGLTQEELAEKVGVSRQAVAKWERGDTTPDIECCMKLSDIFSVTIDMLVRSMMLPSADSDEGKHVFGISKLNEKGQITLPVECRKVFGLNPGDTILVLGDEDKGIALLKLENICEGAETE